MMMRSPDSSDAAAIRVAECMDGALETLRAELGAYLAEDFDLDDDVASAWSRVAIDTRPVREMFGYVAMAALAEEDSAEEAE